MKKTLSKVRAWFRMNPYRLLPAWEYQKPVVEPQLKNAVTVLDIGSGNYPSPRANLLADFSPDDNFHRSGALVEDRLLVVCSIERLPFLSRAIDFVICSHVMEHVSHPGRAAGELQRVAKAGYVETPAYGKDILVGAGYMHRWQVVSFGKTLHFFEYTPRQKEAFVCSPVMKLWMQKRHHPWQDYFWERQDLFNAWLLWRGSFELVEHRLVQESPPPAADWKPVPAELLPDKPCSLAPEEIKLLERVLATPDGRQPMVFREGAFVNEQHHVRYPVRAKRIYFELWQP